MCARVTPAQAMSCTNITWPNNSATRLTYRHHFYGFALLQGSVQVGRLDFFARLSFECSMATCMST